MCCKENPHRKRRKELEKMNREVDNLTPLDARNSLLMDRNRLGTAYENDPKHPLIRQESPDSFVQSPANPYAGATALRPFTPQGYPRMSPAVEESRLNLVRGAAPLGGHAGSPPRQGRSQSREPTIPNLGYGNYR